MEANAPEKIYVNPHALQNLGYNGKDCMFIHDSVFDESKCTIEYTQTDAFIKKVENFLRNNLEDYDLQDEDVDRIIDDFKLVIKL